MSSVPLGTLLSPLDARAERESLGLTLDTFETVPECRSIAQASADFYADPDGELIVRKTWQVAVENRLRHLALTSDPPEKHGFDAINLSQPRHPLDRWAAPRLGLRWKRRPWGGLTRLAHLLLPHAYAAQVIWRAHRIKATAKAMARPTDYWLGHPRVPTRVPWIVFEQALAKRELDENALAFVDERGLPHEVPQGRPVIASDSCPIDRERWTKEVVRPVWKLVIRVILEVARSRADPRVVEAALGCLATVNEVLSFWRVLHAHRFRFYMDYYEYTATHIARAVLLRKYKGRLVRLPHCTMDTPGAALMYWAYDVVMTGGRAEELQSRATWSPHVKTFVCGLMQKDARARANEAVTDPSAQAILKHRAGGGRVLAYFSPSLIAGLVPAIASGLNAVLDSMAAAEDWILVIKSKGPKPYPVLKKILDSHPLAGRYGKEGRLFLIEYTGPVREPCPAAWLIENMDLAVAWGTVLCEALADGRPAFGYYPILQRTPLLDLLRDTGFAFDSPIPLAKAIAAWMDGQRRDVPVEEVRRLTHQPGPITPLDRVFDILTSIEAPKNSGRRHRADETVERCDMPRRREPETA